MPDRNPPHFLWGWGDSGDTAVAAAPEDENRPETHSLLPIAPIFTINAHDDGFSPPPTMKVPWRYRADGAWLSPPPRYETVTASRGSWPVLRNRKRTHVPGLVRLDKGQTRYGEAIGHRHAALPDSCRRNLICPAQRGLGHIQTGVSGCTKRPRPLPAERKPDRRGWLVLEPDAPAPPAVGLTQGRPHFHDKCSWRWAPPPGMKTDVSRCSSDF